MTDWTEVTLLPSLVGGMLIGIATLLLILANGRIAGISGILGGLINHKKNDIYWRLAFIFGLIIAPIVYKTAHPLPIVTVSASNATLIVAGLLVGLGARYGSGCTSGHGICGIARLSPRSIVATLAFMLSGAITVFLVRQLSQ